MAASKVACELKPEAAKPAKALKVEETTCCQGTGTGTCAERDERVRLLAYFRWEQATGGNPVDEEATRRFWEEAAAEVDSEIES